MKKQSLVLVILMWSFCCTAAQDSLKLNQLQVIASHNSYKKRPPEKVMKYLVKMSKYLGEANNPIALDYEHLPFDSQFSNYGIRGLEIDINNDPKGGVFYKRKINALVTGMKQSSGVATLKLPGLKVLHIKDVDYETNYYTFKESLIAIKEWSDTHPNHLPLFINVESKNDAPADVSGALRFLGFKRAIPFDSAACESIDAEIRSVFGVELHKVLTPDIIRGQYNSLDKMVNHQGWPFLSSCRGKVIFIMEGAAVSFYLQNHPGLKGALMFVYSEPGRPEAAFVKRNNASKDKNEIENLVRKGYMVRTRSDAETWEARKNDYTEWNSAQESGAQIISTDYYKADERLSPYHVQWEKHAPGRSNPINGNGNLLKE